jgi:hypothetical protein
VNTIRRICELEGIGEHDAGAAWPATVYVPVLSSERAVDEDGASCLDYSIQNREYHFVRIYYANGEGVVRALYRA